ncbi:MAG: exodeoxyribonuclease VII large subunit [Burkholderiales bacterium]|nr:exodeoxyribonuclease VII large subunit [Burkholderiales bacterium]
MFDFSSSSPSPQVVSVGELNRIAKETLERNLPLMWVAGEISNFKRYDSGHCYFTLKDATAQVDCVMFRHKMQYLAWMPENGMQVDVRALPTLYEARGKFQLNVEAMRRSGLGALHEAFEKLKAKLGAEGLFDEVHKKPLLPFPQLIGVVTSPQAAALRDVLTTLRRRLPGLPVVLYPTPVQGEGAPQKIAAAIAVAARGECDVLIVCRGGGSIEDLWAYNEEVVARAIAACPIPVVTGVGHETDFTIADFVADARAPTPTAAAELASPDRAELARRLEQWHRRLERMTMRVLEDRMQRLDYLARRLVHPGERIRQQSAQLHHFATRMRSAWRLTREARAWHVRELARRFDGARPDLQVLARNGAELARRLHEAARGRLDGETARLAALESHLKHLNPQLVLERGYSITEAMDGRIVRDSATLDAGDELKITFARGWARARIARRG